MVGKAVTNYPLLSVAKTLSSFSNRTSSFVELQERRDTYVLSEGSSAIAYITASIGEIPHPPDIILTFDEPKGTPSLINWPDPMYEVSPHAP